MDERIDEIVGFRLFFLVGGGCVSHMCVDRFLFWRMTLLACFVNVCRDGAVWCSVPFEFFGDHDVFSGVFAYGWLSWFFRMTTLGGWWN